MRFENLPGIPETRVEFTTGENPFPPLSPACRDMRSLLAYAQSAGKRFSPNKYFFRFLEGARPPNDLQRLRQANSLAVLTNVEASLFGGTAAQLLKCLTAVRICEELAKESVTAIPVCWISATPLRSAKSWTVRLLDSQTELHTLDLRRSESEDFSASNPLPNDRISELLERIAELGGGVFDREVFERLKEAYRAGETFASASARFISNLTNEWGMVVMNSQSPDLAPTLSEALASLRDHRAKIEHRLRSQEGMVRGAGHAGGSSETVFPDACLQSLVLPVIACVLDPHEICSFAKALPVFDALDLVKPVAWPRASVTILDMRSRRTLEKYNLTVTDLLAGEAAVLRKIDEATPYATPGKLDSLRHEVERQLEMLSFLDSKDEGFAKARAACGQKVIYQIEKLKRRIEASNSRKQEAMRRQIRRICNSLAPSGRFQESELSGIYFLLRYSTALLRILCKNLDIAKFEHQMISVD